MFASNNDLINAVPGIEDHNHGDWTNELALGENDVVRKIKSDWWNKNMTSTRVLTQWPSSSFDPDLLTPSQWNLATIYLTMYRYILPKLTTWRVEGDAFSQQISHYREMFIIEFEEILSSGVEYDFDRSGTVTSDEIRPNDTGRLYR